MVAYDLHCHILPAIDDGPERTEDAFAMAQVAADDGTSVVVATPHARQVAAHGGRRALAQWVADFNRTSRGLGIGFTAEHGDEGPRWDTWQCAAKEGVHLQNDAAQGFRSRNRTYQRGGDHVWQRFDGRGRRRGPGWGLSRRVTRSRERRQEHQDSHGGSPSEMRCMNSKVHERNQAMYVFQIVSKRIEHSTAPIMKAQDAG